MEKVTITLTEHQVIALIQGLEAYDETIEKNNWRATGLVPEKAFIKRLQNKLRQELV